jgi:serine/threonine protein kinase
MASTCRAVQWLHHQIGLAHLDLKLENIGLNDDLKAFLIDLGSAGPIEGVS